MTISDAPNCGVTYDCHLRSSLMIVTYDRHLRSSLTIVTYDRHLRSLLMIVTYDHHLRSQWFYNTGHWVQHFL